MKLFDLNPRDIKGLWMWFLVSIIIGLFSFPIMIGREIYQAKTLRINIEWEDIIRYTIVIISGSIFNLNFLLWII